MRVSGTGICFVLTSLARMESLVGLFDFPAKCLNIYNRQGFEMQNPAGPNTAWMWITSSLPWKQDPNNTKNGSAFCNAFR